jgi:3-dehydroquinate synthase
MSVTRIPVEIPDAPYEVVVGRGLLNDIGKETRRVTTAPGAALITDYDVAGLYAAKVDIGLARSEFRVVPMKVPSGETSKSWQRCGELLEAMASNRIGRDDIVVALGGGVVGDLAGFASAVYLRGVGFVQVPTTLLAMVDSSVGGKTGVDLIAGKNLVGAFKQPLAVIADTEVLDTLPDSEWTSGMAEVVKSAIIDGEDFMSWLEANGPALDERAPEAVDEIVGRCVRFKASVVASDERECGMRECLNYGHTLGHALEKVLGYGAVSHGVAVAEGIRFASRVSIDLAGASPAFAKRQDGMLDAAGLQEQGFSADPKDLLEAMHSDKKARGGEVRMVLASAPGVWTCETVSDTVMAAHLEAWASARRGEQA